MPPLPLGEGWGEGLPRFAFTGGRGGPGPSNHGHFNNFVRDTNLAYTPRRAQCSRPEETMLERLELHHVGPAPELIFDFASRLNLITGDNGVGKTFVLDVAWWGLTRTWVGHLRPVRGKVEAHQLHQ
jgi:hypothetical protein